MFRHLEDDGCSKLEEQITSLALPSGRRVSRDAICYRGSLGTLSLIV